MKTKKKFKVVRSPFGGVDERATHDAFVEFVGGRDRADRLFWIWKHSYEQTVYPSYLYKPVPREQVFREKAKREGFTDEEVDAFLSL